MAEGIFELFFHTIFFLACLAGLIWRIRIKDRGIMFLEFEIWSLIGELVYYAIQTLTGFINICNKASDNMVQKFLKSTLFKIIFPFTLNSVVIFYLGYFQQWFYFYDNPNTPDFWYDILVHGIVQCCILLDAILFRRKFTQSNIFDKLIIIGVYVFYCILMISFQTNHTYLFMTNGNGFLICFSIVSGMSLFVMHYLCQIITRVRNGIRPEQTFKAQ